MQDNKKLSPIRESVTTINQDGSRFFLHPADVRGPYTLWRRVVGLLLIIFFVVLPCIPIQGHPALFLDIAHRRFHILGLTFAAQDFWMTYFVITGLGFSLFFLTALFGRLWCGWACPQTVFLDQVFRRIERWIEGDAQARRKLDQAPMSPQKLRKRCLKHTSFALLSIFIAHISFLCRSSTIGYSTAHSSTGMPFSSSVSQAPSFILISPGSASNCASLFVPMDASKAP